MQETSFASLLKHMLKERHIRMKNLFQSPDLLLKIAKVSTSVKQRSQNEL